MTAGAMQGRGPHPQVRRVGHPLFLVLRRKNKKSQPLGMTTGSHAIGVMLGRTQRKLRQKAERLRGDAQRPSAPILPLAVSPFTQREKPCVALTPGDAGVPKTVSRGQNIWYSRSVK